MIKNFVNSFIPEIIVAYREEQPHGLVCTARLAAHPLIYLNKFLAVPGDLFP